MEDIILTGQMDRAVPVLAEDFPDFVTAYGKARNIIDGPSDGKN